MMRWLMVSLLSLLLLTGCPPKAVETTATDQATTAAVDNSIHYLWTQAFEDDLIARVVMADSSTYQPRLQWTDGGQTRTTPMTLRASASADFPILVYESTIPGSSSAASVLDERGQALDLPVLPAGAMVDNVAVIGDTGCRQKKSDCQDCGDRDAWPFAQVADQVAQHNPDLILHVGDYHYRETGCTCPEIDGIKCKYNWATWEADFFAPAANLLAEAPLVPTRGNHENCDRAWQGWFRLLDPLAYSGECETFQDPYPVVLDNALFIVMDVADTDSYDGLNQSQLPALQADFADVQSIAQAHASTLAAVMTHQPIWDVYSATETSDITLQTALVNELSNQFASSIVLELAGHNHLFRWMDFDQSGSVKRAPEFIVGNGGTELNDGLEDLAGYTVGDVKIHAGHSQLNTFGYCILNPSGTDWVITRYDLGNSHPSATYTLTNNQVNAQ